MLFVLAEHANSETLEIFLYMTTIAKEARVARTTAMRSVQHLEEDGFIEVARQHRSRSAYTLLMPTPGLPLGLTNGPNKVPQTDSSVSETDSRCSVVGPQTGIEPVINRSGEPVALSGKPPSKEGRVSDPAPPANGLLEVVKALTDKAPMSATKDYEERRKELMRQAQELEKREEKPIMEKENWRSTIDRKTGEVINGIEIKCPPCDEAGYDGPCFVMDHAYRLRCHELQQKGEPMEAPVHVLRCPEGHETHGQRACQTCPDCGGRADAVGLIWLEMDDDGRSHWAKRH